MKIESPKNHLERIQITESNLSTFIRKKGLISSLIKEILIDEHLEDYESESEEQIRLLDEFRANKNILDDFKYKEFLNSNQLNEALLKELITRPHNIKKFRESKWGGKVNSLYLKHKHQYDKVIYKQITCSSQDTMQEVYFRLKAGEETWGEIAKQFLGPQNKSEGLKGPLLCKNVDAKLLLEMKKSGIKKITKPVRIDATSYAICSLVKIVSTELDDGLRDEILNLEFNDWLENTSNRILNTIEY